MIIQFGTHSIGWQTVPVSHYYFGVYSKTRSVNGVHTDTASQWCNSYADRSITLDYSVAILTAQLHYNLKLSKSDECGAAFFFNWESVYAFIHAVSINKRRWERQHGDIGDMWVLLGLKPRHLLNPIVFHPTVVRAACVGNHGIHPRPAASTCFFYRG
jgi:hypothetical protein